MKRLNFRKSLILAWGIGLTVVTITAFGPSICITVVPFLGKTLYEFFMTFLVAFGVGTLSGSTLYVLLPGALGLNLANGTYYRIKISIILVVLNINEASAVEDNHTMPRIILTSENSDNREEYDDMEYYELEKERLKSEFEAAVKDPHDKIAVNVEVVEEKILDPSELDVATVTWMIMFGSLINNFLDGMSNGAAFANSLPRGFSIGIAVITQQLPQEIGTLAILIQSGLGFKRTLLLNLFPNSLSYLGFIIGVLIGNVDDSYGNYIFAASSGMYLYVFLGTLIPEIRDSINEQIKVDLKRSIRSTVLQAIGITTGIVLMHLIYVSLIYVYANVYLVYVRVKCLVYWTCMMLFDKEGEKGKRSTLQISSLPAVGMNACSMQELQAMKLFVSCILLLYFDSTVGISFSRSLMNKYRDKVKAMFYHAYNSYLLHAYPLDELKPLSCSGMDTWGGFSLTLIDSLDTLLIMGNETEFMRAAEIILRTVKVDMDVNVSVFETNIRVIGGLLSAHMLSGRVKEMELEPGWPCSGPLLRLAERFIQKLIPAFKSATGMPYGTINLKYGLHRNETAITCTAGIGTMLLEFVSTNILFLGNPQYEQIALKALDALWKLRSPLNLVGNHINVETGEWTATDAGIGAGVDSYFEYLAKAALLFQHPELMKQFKTYVKAINKYIRKDDWFVWISMTSGQLSMPIFQSLESFWPGILALTGDVDDAQRIIYQYSQVIRQYGFPPEFFNLVKQETVSKRAGYPLRPEFVESLYYVYRATQDPLLLEIAAEIVDAIEYSCRTKCGYATIVNAEHHSVEDRMESFFLSETAKYLYLLFDPDNFINANGTIARIVETPNGQCIIDAGGYIFNTEAHPLDPAIVYCCSAKRNSDLEMISRFENNIDLVSLMGIFDETLHPSGRSSEIVNNQELIYLDNQQLNFQENMKNDVRDVQLDKNLLKQSSLANPWLYDYVTVYDDRCLYCCWPTDFNIENVPFRRFLNVVFAKHIYPASSIQFSIGLICLPIGNNVVEALYKLDWKYIHEMNANQKFSSIDEIRFNKFRYRNMAELGYDVLLTPPLSYLSRFTGLGQVKPKPYNAQ
ncbi:unnamed protein product [Onchocerca flexuosa]|uniref:alpha-1,2-Mannosidase n=1 Tax=Onchocerca flexuosa TaxID=387005 RepID=A0A3P8EXP9_9BILA|nr:unnamed protein product [Onchocerca flexuosa]